MAELTWGRIIIYVIRSLIIGLGLHFGGKFIDKYNFKNGYLKKRAKKERRTRLWMIKFAWQIALGALLFQIIWRLFIS